MPDIVVIDGHVLFAELLAGVLADHGYRAVGTAATGEAGIELVDAGRPTLCVVDHHALTADADLARRLVAAGDGRTRVVVMTDEVDEAALRPVRGAGTHGVVHKGDGVAALLEVLVRVRAGEQVLRLPRPPSGRRPEVVSAVQRLADALTQRERECLALLVDGLTTAQMVDELGISVMTVRSHVRSVLTKLGVHSRLEAASLAVRHGLVDLAESRAG